MERIWRNKREIPSCHVEMARTRHDERDIPSPSGKSIISWRCLVRKWDFRKWYRYSQGISRHPRAFITINNLENALRVPWKCLGLPLDTLSVLGAFGVPGHWKAQEGLLRQNLFFLMIFVKNKKNNQMLTNYILPESPWRVDSKCSIFMF